jgi:hypothetical protein
MFKDGHTPKNYHNQQKLYVHLEATVGPVQPDVLCHKISPCSGAAEPAAFTPLFEDIAYRAKSGTFTLPDNYDFIADADSTRWKLARNILQS